MTTTAEHTDTVCPPDPTAACDHCGDELQHHASMLDPDFIPTPDDAWCLDQSLLARWVVSYRRFALAAGESLDCPNRMGCDVCDQDVCAEHTNEVANCQGNRAAVHHLACVWECDQCAPMLAEDARAGR